MPALRRVELDDLLNRPGSYYNPATEVLIVVDDSAEVDAEIFASEELEDTDWVLISDEVPVEESARDALLERFAITFHPEHAGEDDVADEEDELDPDPDPED